MNNTATGLLIKALRKEKDMTQKQLAALLHITDKAVSKWERGLCAPDIALLEPLSRALDVTIAELIAGRRNDTGMPAREAETAAAAAIAYSNDELTRKTRLTRRRSIVIGAAWAALALALILGALWYGGSFSIIGRAAAPDGGGITVFSRDITGLLRPRVVTVRREYPAAAYTQAYPGAKYIGAWYAPEGNAFVMALEYDGASRLLLCDYLLGGSEEAILPGLPGPQSEYSDVSCQFLSWGGDSASVLVYYTARGPGAEAASGIFWYGCDSGEIYGNQNIS